MNLSQRFRDWAYIFGFLIVAYTIYVWLHGKVLDLAVEFVGSRLSLLKPEELYAIRSDSTFRNSIIFVAVKLLNGLIWFAITFTPIYIFTKVVINKRKALQTNLEDTHILGKGNRYWRRYGVSRAPIIIIKPLAPITKSEIAKSKGESLLRRDLEIDTTPYPEWYLNLKSNDTPHEGDNSYQVLWKSILATLNYYSEVPACVTGHHSIVTLKEHSLQVTEKLKELSIKQNLIDKLVPIIGLSHDLDKLIVYRKRGDLWYSKSKYHHQFSQYVVKHLAGFDLLPEDDRSTLLNVLRYYHDPDLTPRKCSNRTNELIKLLRQADGLTTQQEQQSQIKTNINDPETQSELTSALNEAFLNLNINGHRQTKDQDGWTKPTVEFIAIPLKNIFKAVQVFLSPSLNKKLMTEVKSASDLKHPLAEPILFNLQHRGYLILEHKKLYSKSGIFHVRSGQFVFYPTVLINKDIIERDFPNLLEKWGTSDYAIKVVDADQ